MQDFVSLNNNNLVLDYVSIIYNSNNNMITEYNHMRIFGTLCDVSFSCVTKCSTVLLGKKITDTISEHPE